MDWNVLGIEPTKDIEKINAAYEEKLQQIDLEYHPEEFDALKKAYEQALVLAEDHVMREPSGNTRGFKTMFAALYKDFALRTDTVAWDSLLDQAERDYGKNRTMNLLLDELMDSHVLPAEVWKFLEDRYHFTEQKEILYGNYPKAFVNDVILRGPSQKDLLPFDLFVPGKDGAVCEDYMKLYYQAINSRPDQAKDIIAQMNALSEQHPYGKSLEARNAVVTGDPSKITVLESIAAKYPDRYELQMNLAIAYMAASETGKCEEVCRKLLETDPSDIPSKVLLAQAIAAMGRYKEASDIVSDVIRDPSADMGIIGRLSAMRAEWNMPVIREYEQAEASGKADDDQLLDHAWRCLQNNMIEEAAEIAGKIDSRKADKVSYTDLMNQIWFVTGDYSKALKSADELIDLAKKDDSLKGRLPEFFARKANSLYTGGDSSGAIDTYKEALDTCGNDRNILTMLSRILLSEKNFGDAGEYSRRLIRAFPQSYLGHYLLSESLFGSGDLKAASDAVDEALQLETGDIDPFVLKMRILIENKAFGDTETMLDMLRRSGADDITGVKWCSALVKEMKYHKDDEALDDYFDIAERIESGEYVSWAAKVYYRIALCMGAQIDREDTESMQRVRDAVNKGLRIDPDDKDLKKYLSMLDGTNAEGLTLAD